MQLFYGTYFTFSVVFQLKLAAYEVCTVDKLRRVSIANRQYQRVFKRVIELKFFCRAISNYEKVEKEIEIQQEAVQLGAEVRGEFQF